MPVRKVKNNNDVQIIRKGKANRIYYKYNCENCGNEIIKRKDEFLKIINKKKLCRSCSMLNTEGYLNGKGYVVKHYKSFPREYWDLLKNMCKPNGQITEHRAVMSIYLNREIKDNELIHHKNYNKTDNRIENLELITGSEHSHLHIVELINENKRLKEEVEILKEKNKCLLKELEQKKE